MKFAIFTSTFFIITASFFIIVLSTEKEIQTDQEKSTYSKTQEEECNLSQALKDEIQSYQSVADRILDLVLKGEWKGRAYEELGKFVDKFPNRLSGSPGLEHAIDYMVNEVKIKGIEDVTTQSVPVTHWVRGEEHAKLVEPVEKKLNILGFGPTVGTPAEGIIAEVVVVHNFTDLDNQKDLVPGKIVVYNQGWVDTYGDTVVYRLDGAVKAAQYGAVATLVESITPYSLDTPHTGITLYSPNVTKIPIAGITREDAEMISRIYSRGEKIVIKLTLMDETYEPAISRNTFASIRGMDEKVGHEIVAITGHIDAWDVGQGAMDDATGIIITSEALAIIRHLGLTPRRTLQGIFWTAEETDFEGVRGFIRENVTDLINYNGAFEADFGTFQPLGIDFAGHPEAGCIVEEVLQLLKSINATLYRRFDVVGADISKLIPYGVPALNLNTKNDEYFYFHHSAADMLGIQNSDEFDMCTAFYAITSYVLADLSVSLPRLNISQSY